MPRTALRIGGRGPRVAWHRNTRAIRPTTPGLLTTFNLADAAQWVPNNGAIIITPNQPAPYGRSDAFEVSYPVAINTEIADIVGLTVNGLVEFSVWARSDAVSQFFRLKIWNNIVDTFSAEFALTPTWTRYRMQLNTVEVINVGLANDVSGTALSAEFWRPALRMV